MTNKVQAKVDFIMNGVTTNSIGYTARADGALIFGRTLRELRQRVRRHVVRTHNGTARFQRRWH